MFHLYEMFRIGKSIAAGSSGCLALGETVGDWKGDGSGVWAFFVG